jgi:hypothetical protein
MRKTNRVVMLGNTLVLAGIQTSVNLDKQCEVIARPLQTGLAELVELQPDALIYELDSLPGEFLYGLSRELPELLQIGVDPETNRAIFWSGQEAAELTSRDLARAIHHTGKTGPLGPLKKSLD